VRQFIISEDFFKKIAEKGKLYSRIWMYWLGKGFVDEIFENGFIEKQVEAFKNWKEVTPSEINEIYHFGVQHLQQGFKIVKKQKEIPKETQELAEKIIDYLNEKSGKKFTKKPNNIKPILSRLKEGYNYEDFQFVIDKKIYDWKGTNFQEYIRPITLFSNKLFENYINTQNDTKSTTNFDKFAIAISKAQSITFRTDE
jgi:uncharacterized phage protein (TIGR02220 family)